MDQTRTRTWSGVPSGVAITGNQDLGTWLRVPLRLLVTRRPADGPDKDEDMVGGAIWRGNHRKSGSRDMVECKWGSGLLKSRLCFLTSKNHKQDYKQRGTTTWG